MNHQTQLLPESLLQNVQFLPAEAKVSAGPTRVDLEGPKRISESKIWEIVQDFYKQQGIDAWKGVVPFFVTNSIMIANGYADMIIAYLRDYRDHLNFDEPLYIVEMACGSGRFHHYLLRELARKRQYYKELDGLKIIHVMTDFTENNIQFWESHENFKPFVEAGVLDFALFSPEVDEAVELRVSRKTLSRNTVKNPMIALANYFIDTVRQDYFQVRAKSLVECKMSLSREIGGEITADTPIHIKQVIPSYSYHNVSEEYYPNPKWNALLSYFRENLDFGSFFFPVGGFNCIRNLEKISNNNLVLIASDKAFPILDDFKGIRDPEFVLHGGAFSTTANFHAFQQYFNMEGGISYASQDRSLGLHTMICIQKKNDLPWENLNYFYGERVNRYNPLYYMVEVESMYGAVPESMDKIKQVNSIIGFLRLCLCDPQAFYQCSAFLMNSVDAEMNKWQREDVLAILEEVHRNYYFFQGEPNVPFWLGQIYYSLNVFEKSLECFQEALNLFGEHHVLYYFMGNCLESLNNHAEALPMYQKSVELAPDFCDGYDAIARLSV